MQRALYLVQPQAAPALVAEAAQGLDVALENLSAGLPNLKVLNPPRTIWPRSKPGPRLPSTVLTLCKPNTPCTRAGS